MSIWASVHAGDAWIVYDRWDDGEPDEDHRVFMDVASSSASPCVRLIVDRSYEYHIADREPFENVLILPEEARELARRLVIAADRAEEGP